MDRLNQALTRIEEQLLTEGGPDIAAIARQSLTGEHHFRRMFSSLAGMSVSEYVRRRRMTLAAAAIVEKREAIQDVALRFGYSSADAFSRAFRGVHGLGPAEARNTDAVLTWQPALSFQLTVKGRTSMDYRITDRPAFLLAGWGTTVPIIHEGDNSAIIDFERGLDPAAVRQLAALSRGEPAGLLAVSTRLSRPGVDEGEQVRYAKAVATTRKAFDDAELPGGVEITEVPALTWVVFTTTGTLPESAQQLWAHSFGEWLPQHPYELVEAPEILRIDEKPVRGDEYHSELWLAVRRIP